MSRPPRLPGFRYRGVYRYFLTFCTRERARHFDDAETVAATLVQIRNTARREGFSLLAYCVMPDHAHLIVEATTAASDLTRFAKMAKQRSGGVFARRAGRRLWQEGYYDHIVRDDEDLPALVRYVLNNPVRAGLVEHPSAYPWVGSDVWTIEELLEGSA